MNRVANFCATVRNSGRGSSARTELCWLALISETGSGRAWRKKPSDFHGMTVRNLERTGVSRLAAMMMVGHRSESVYRGIAIANEVMLRRVRLHLLRPVRKGSGD